MINIFSGSLRSQRESRGWTQSEMIDFLSDAVSDLSGIDTVTLSRWERSITEPNQFRQSQVLAALGMDWYEVTKGKICDVGASRANLPAPLRVLLSMNAFPPMLYSGGDVERKVISTECDEAYIEDVLWRLSGYRYGVVSDVLHDSEENISGIAKLIKRGKKKLVLTTSKFGVVTGHAILGVYADADSWGDLGVGGRDLFEQGQDKCLLLEGGYAGDAISFLKIFGFILSEVCNIQLANSRVVSFTHDTFLMKTLKNIGFREEVGVGDEAVKLLQFSRGDAYSSKKAVSLALIEDCCSSVSSLFEGKKNSIDTIGA